MRINYRLRSGYATVISWHPLMFVAISKSEKAIINIRSINEKYSQTINKEYAKKNGTVKVIP